MASRCWSPSQMAVKMKLSRGGMMLLTLPDRRPGSQARVVSVSGSLPATATTPVSMRWASGRYRWQARVQRRGTVRADVDPVTLQPVGAGVGPLVDGGAHPGPAQPMRQAQAADAAADDQDVRGVIRHTHEFTMHLHDRVRRVLF